MSSAVLVVSVVLTGCGASSAAPPTTPPAATAAAASRPSTWAVEVDRPGLPNLYRVTDRIYRGAQPTAEGFAELKKMGVKSVVDLRAAHDDAAFCARYGLQCFAIREKAWHPEDEDTAEFLRLVTDPANQPVFVHCQHGADRTGTSIAAYRVVIQGWTRDAAAREMTQGGFGFHPIWTDLVEYVRDLDVPALRARLRPASP